MLPLVAEIEAIDIDRKGPTSFAPDGAPELPEQPALVVPVLSISWKPERRLLALAMAVLGHRAVLYVLMRTPDDLMTGGGGQQIDAICITNRQLEGS